MAKPKGPKPANASKSETTPPKQRKPNNPNQTGTKTTRGKRGSGAKKNNPDGNSAAVEADAGENGTKSTPTTGKKKRNKKRDSQGGNQADGETKKTPHIKDAQKYNSDKQNAKVYAWSAFQSSPDPSALPDIGGLFLGGADGEAKEGEAGAAREGDDVGSSVSSLSLGPPSDHIRTSLVNSMLGENPNAGEALLKSLTKSNREPVSCSLPPVHEQFRTAEDLEAEMLSPSLKPDEKPAVDPSSLPALNLASASNDEQGAVKKREEEKPGDVEGQPRSISANPAEQPPPISMRRDYPDAITQLMNPGGYSAGGYGMHQPMPHPHQHSFQQHAPYHFPLHQGPPPPNYPYPMPPPQHHMPPYYPMQPRPGFTTVQVRVPQALLPGNTMIVENMQIQVPPGVPPGAIIPVNIPIPMQQQHPQHYYGHPPPHYPGYHPHNVSPHPSGEHPMMSGHQMPIPPPPPQETPQPSSWAARVANGSPTKSGKTEPKESTGDNKAGNAAKVAKKSSAEEAKEKK